MEHLKEFNGITVKGNQTSFGQKFEDGMEIRLKQVANYQGFKCQIWAPEFHSLLFDSAISNAFDAERLRKRLAFTKNEITGVTELLDSNENLYASFQVMQKTIITTVSCISAVESWANKTIHSELSGQQASLTFPRFNQKKRKNEDVCWEASRIEKDTQLSEKVFTVIPLIYQTPPIKKHVTLRKRFNELIRDRNAFMHLKNLPQVNGKQINRADLSLKLLKSEALLIPKNTMHLVKMIYDKSNQAVPLWLAQNLANLENLEKQLRIKNAG